MGAPGVWNRAGRNKSNLDLAGKRLGTVLSYPLGNAHDPLQTSRRRSEYPLQHLRGVVGLQKLHDRQPAGPAVQDPGARFQPASGAALTATYTGRTTANWIDFLGKVERWIDPIIERVYAVVDNLNTLCGRPPVSTANCGTPSVTQ